MVSSNLIIFYLVYVTNNHEEHREHEEKILKNNFIFNGLFLRELRGLQ